MLKSCFTTLVLHTRKHLVTDIPASFFDPIGQRTIATYVLIDSVRPTFKMSLSLHFLIFEREVMSTIVQCQHRKHSINHQPQTWLLDQFHLIFHVYVIFLLIRYLELSDIKPSTISVSTIHPKALSLVILFVILNIPLRRMPQVK